MLIIGPGKSPEEEMKEKVKWAADCLMQEEREKDEQNELAAMAAKLSRVLHGTPSSLTTTGPCTLVELVKGENKRSSEDASAINLPFDIDFETKAEEVQFMNLLLVELNNRIQGSYTLTYSGGLHVI